MWKCSCSVACAQARSNRAGRSEGQAEGSKPGPDGLREAAFRFALFLRLQEFGRLHPDQDIQKGVMTGGNVHLACQKATGGHIQKGQTGKPVSGLCRPQDERAEKAFPLFVQKLVFRGHAGRNHPHHLPPDNALCRFGVFNLLAEGHPVACADHFGQIAAQGMVGHPAHGHFGLVIPAPGRQGDPHNPGAQLGVVQKHLVKIADPIKEHSVRILRFHLQILLEHGGDFGGRGAVHKSGPIVLEIGQKHIKAAFDVLGNGAQLGQHGHEIVIARPAGHHVEVQMSGDACARTCPQIQTYVQAFGMKTPSKRLAAKGQHGHERTVFLRREVGKIACMAAWGHEQVTVRVGKAVQKHDQQPVTEQEQMRLVAGSFAWRLEQAACCTRSRSRHVLHAPGCP